MTLSELLEEVRHLSTTNKTLFVEVLLSELPIMNRAILQAPDADQAKILEALEWSNELNHRIGNIHFELRRFDDDEAIPRLFANVNEHRKRSDLLAGHLAATLQSSWQRFTRLPKSFDHGEDISLENRYLLITNQVPLPEALFPTREAILAYYAGKENWRNDIPALEQDIEHLLSRITKPQVHSLLVYGAYGNLTLPKTFEVIYNIDNKEQFWEQKSVILAAINYRNCVHWDLWRGHHSHCFIEIYGEAPSLIQQLSPHDQIKKGSPRIALCSKHNWQFIRKAK